MNFLQFLAEADNYKPESVYNQILPYKKHAGVFMNFTSVDSSKPHEHEIHDVRSAVPYGIFAYRLQDVWKHYHIDEHQGFSHLPYSSKKPFIHLFRFNHKLVDISNYNNLEHDLLMLDQRYGHIITLNIKTRIEQSKNQFSTLWNTTREIAYLLNPDHLEKQWTTILRNLGYGGFFDSKNTNLLHGEPHQTLILQLDNIMPIKTILNQDYKNTKTELLKITSVNDILHNLERHPVKLILKSIDGQLAKLFQQYLEDLNNKNHLLDFLDILDANDSKLVVLVWLNGHVNFKHIDPKLSHYLSIFTDIEKTIHFAKHVAKFPWDSEMLRHNLELSKVI